MSFPSLAPNGSSPAPSYSFSGEPTTGLYRAGAGDMRLGVLNVDTLFPALVTTGGAGVTNGPSLGIGGTPLRPGLQIQANASSFWTGCELYNTNLTDGNAAAISFRADQNGAAPGSFGQYGQIRHTFDLHDSTNKSSHFDILWTATGVGKTIQLTGDRVIQSDTGSISLATGGGNGNITLAPNGTGQVILATAKPLRIQTGTNQRAGDAVLVGGTVTVANTTVTANTRVFLTRKTSGGTIGDLKYSLAAGTSFTITSASGTDTSTVSYFLVEVS